MTVDDARSAALASPPFARNGTATSDDEHDDRGDPREGVVVGLPEMRGGPEGEDARRPRARATTVTQARSTVSWVLSPSSDLPAGSASRRPAARRARRPRVRGRERRGSGGLRVSRCSVPCASRGRPRRTLPRMSPGKNAARTLRTPKATSRDFGRSTSSEARPEPSAAARRTRTRTNAAEERREGREHGRSHRRKRREESRRAGDEPELVPERRGSDASRASGAAPRRLRPRPSSSVPTPQSIPSRTEYPAKRMPTRRNQVS